MRVVILNYFGQEDVVECLKSLETHIKIKTDVVVWNNGGATDLISDHAKKLLNPDINIFVVPSKSNVGFAPGVNRACEWKPERDFEALLLLNSDATLLTRLDEAKFQELLALKSVVGFKVYNNAQKTERQKSARSFPSLITSFTSRQSFVAKIFPNNPWTKKYLNLDLSENTPQKVDWVSGCALFTSHVVWKKLGAFDEAYFFSVEDVDLGRTAQKKSVPVLYYPGIEVLHVGGVAAGRSAWKSDFYHHLGMWVYFIKWARPLEFLVCPFVFAGILFRFLFRRVYQVKTGF